TPPEYAFAFTLPDAPSNKFNRRKKTKIRRKTGTAVARAQWHRSSSDGYSNEAPDRFTGVSLRSLRICGTGRISIYDLPGRDDADVRAGLSGGQRGRQAVGVAQRRRSGFGQR